MTDLNNQNKLQKYKDRVYNFLDGNRYDEESKERPTHIAYGGFTGKFTLSGEKQKEFMRLYTSAIKHGIFDMSILETQNEYGPIIIDLDFKIPIEDYKGGRLYNKELIKKVLERYIIAIDHYLLISPDKYKICIFEKKKTQEKDIVFNLLFILFYQKYVFIQKLDI